MTDSKQPPVPPTKAKRRAALIPPEQKAAERQKIREVLHIEDTVERYVKRIRNPQTAIRAFCIACTGGSQKDVLECTAPKCALYPFRMGRNPFRKKSGAAAEGEGEDANLANGDEDGEDSGDDSVLDDDTEQDNQGDENP